MQRLAGAPRSGSWVRKLYISRSSILGYQAQLGSSVLESFRRPSSRAFRIAEECLSMRAQKGEKQKPFLTPAREVGITEEKFCRSICSIRAPSTFSNPVDRVRV